MGKLDGRTAVVTGGGTGLGREIVEAYAAAGATVVIASRKLDACERAAAEVRDRHQVEALGISCNVGTAPVYRDLTELTEHMWRKVLEINLLGAAALYLAGDESAFVTGAILELDGGATF